MQLKVAVNWFQLLFLNYLAEVKIVEYKQFHTKWEQKVLEESKFITKV